MERALERLMRGIERVPALALLAVIALNWISSLAGLPLEAKRYLQLATSGLPAILASDRQLKEDYEALAAAAKRHRK